MEAPPYLVEVSNRVEIHERFFLQLLSTPLYCHFREMKGEEKLYTREIFLEILTLLDEAGVEHCFHYYIVMDQLELEGYAGESYGIKIEEKETGQVAVVPHVTTRSSEIYQLARTLIDHQVTPCTLVDVIQDWL